MATGRAPGTATVVAGTSGATVALTVTDTPVAVVALDPVVVTGMSLSSSSAGAAFDDVIEFVGYFTHLQRDYPLFQTVKDRYVTGELPAQTVIGVSELSMAGLLIELKCTALIPG